MSEIWANQLWPKALKSCPNSNISPNLVTLLATKHAAKAVSRTNTIKLFRLI